MAPSSKALLSPVLLLGAGRGEATCGLLYLGAYLRRNGVEASVRLCDWDQTDEELTRSLKQLLAFTRPRVVGLSLKWYLHLHRALVIARILRKLDPSLRIVLGGNTAALYWQQLLAHDCIDDIVLGDGEAPMLALCRGEEAPPNSARRGPGGLPVKMPFGYVQTQASDEVYYSHFKELFLSELDLSGFSGWVAPGKGCDQSCVYCGGRRAAQRLSFGRPNPFLRSHERVQQDHHELLSLPHVWQFRYDFPGGSSDYLCHVWPGLQLKRHSTTYFLWGVPDPALVRGLSEAFHRVALVLDIGCFSQTQRDALMGKSLLKPCPSDQALMAAIDDCLRYANVELEVCGIAGLPLGTPEALAEERALVERMLARGCKVGYQRLQSQPGALVTEHPERFGMVSEASTFEQFLSYFQKRTPAQRGQIPMVRYADKAMEKAVQRNCDRLDELLAQHAAKQEGVVTGSTRLKATVAASRETKLVDWLGAWRVPATVAQTKVTVLRSANGAGMACAPTLDARRFTDALVEDGEAGAVLLSTLEAFARPTPLDAGLSKLEAKLGLPPEASQEVVDHLLTKQFLSRA
jgi:hypothetical protein